MKRLTCEICGSTDIMKENGVFVCQTCGTKYSIEEAKKMMAEGTDQVASPNLTSNYLSMAKNALDAGNNAEAEKYCNKIIEVDPTSYEAWFIKGKAVGWQSTLGNQRIAETINAFSNALANCPEEKKEELGGECKREIESLHKALLTLRMKNFMNHPNENDVASLKGDVTNIITNSVNFLVKAGINANTFGVGLGSVIMNTVIGNYNEKIWKEYQGDEGKPNDYEFKRFMSETDHCITALNFATTLLGSDDTDDLDLYDWRALAYDSMIKLNTFVRDACSWDYNITAYGKQYYKNLALNDTAVKVRNSRNAEWEATAKKWRSEKEKKVNAIKAEEERKAKEEAKKRFDAYWEAHADEKIKLEAELDTINKQLEPLVSSEEEQISGLEKQISSIRGGAELAAIEERINQLTEEKASLGVFKTKEKKALQEKIDQAAAVMKKIQDKMDSEKKAIETRIAAIRAEFEKRAQPLRSRAEEIRTELTKER